MLPHFCCTTNRIVKQILFFVFSLFLVTICVNLIYVPVVDVDVQTSQSGLFQIFWSSSQGAYSESHSGYYRDVNPARSHYRFQLKNLTPGLLPFTIKYLRIDPLDQPGEILIKKIRISQGGLFSVDFDSAEAFQHIKIVDGIKDMQVTKEGLRVVTSGTDPKLEIKVTFIPHYEAIALFCLAILLLLYTLKYVVGRIDHFTCHVEWFFFFVLALIMTMAAISRPDMHPDEKLHMRAAAYYQNNHWLPPAADDPEIETTYSKHGVSRLNSPEIVYVLAGKFLRFFSFLPLERFVILRFFNISLFALLLVIYLKRPEVRIVCLPLFISPQIWYVFSYFNSDAFALFVLFIITYQVAIDTSFLNRYLREHQRSFMTAAQGMGLGCLFSMLFLIKKNFYFFVVFLFLYFLVQLYRRQFPDPLLIIKKLGLILVTSLCIFSSYYAFHAAVNGWHQSEAVSRMQENTADENFKPSVDPHRTYFGANLRGKGVPLSHVWKNMAWGHITFMSCFGVYGNMHFYGSSEYYDTVQLLLILALMSVLFDMVCSRAHDGSALLFALVVICATALVGASLLNSWIADFQAQGRYLLPIVPMIGLFLYSARHILHKGRMNFFVLVFFLFSSYSFIFLGLREIPKL